MLYFEPSADRAMDLRHNMDEALLASAKDMLAAGDVSIGVGPFASPSQPPQRMKALDYGAYFDLALSSIEQCVQTVSTIEAARQHLMRCLVSAPETASAPSVFHSPGGLPSVTTLSLAFYTPPELARFARWWDMEPDNAMGLTGISDGDLYQAREHLNFAFAQLGECAPILRDEILAIISEIIVARPDGKQRMDFGGASSFALWGAMAINLDAHDDWPRYFQTLVHEAGHNLLFAIARNEPLVLNAADEAYNSPLRDDPRPMDGVFHAAFVSARESLALDALLCWHEATGELLNEDVDEVEFLLDGSVTAFWECAGVLREDGRLSPLGDAILAECEEFMTTSFALQTD